MGLVYQCMSLGFTLFLWCHLELYSCNRDFRLHMDLKRNAAANSEVQAMVYAIANTALA